MAVSASRDGSLVAGFAFDDSYYLPPDAEGARQKRSRGQVVVWDAAGPRVLAEELSGLVANPDDLANSTPLFVGQTQDAIMVIGNGADHGWVARLAPR